MKNIDTQIKSSKHKKRRCSSVDSSMSSSDSENDTFPLIKENQVSDGDSSSSSSSSSHQVKKCKKRRRCRHKRRPIEDERVRGEVDSSQRLRDHHHSHKRHHKRKEWEREEKEHRRRHDGDVRIKVESVDVYYSSRHSHPSQRRQPDERSRTKLEEDQHNNHARKRQHRISRRGDGERQCRRREEGQPSRDRRSESYSIRGHRRQEEDFSVTANRPIKQEQVSDGEPEFEWGKKSDTQNKKKEVPPGEKDKPNFALSGKLVEDTNVFNGVVIKYSEPPEARKPKRRWRFYPFKGDQGLPTLYIHRQSCYLLGRDRKVADIPTDHPSCSKQHAALQYRLVPFERDNGTTGQRVRPYIIDLESANGTFVNNVKIEPKKYVELLERDVVKFGYSSREYVLLHEQSKDDELDDDVAAGAEDE